MQIADRCVVTFAYTLRDAAGAVLDQADAAEPFTYLHGRNSIVPGLERGLAGQAPGARCKVTVTPQDGYGMRDEKLVQVVAREQFDTETPLAVGMQFHTRDEGGAVHMVAITAITEAGVTIDANHPLAGQTLNFDVEILDVRQATAEELAHGHAHGPGAHHH